MATETTDRLVARLQSMILDGSSHPKFLSIGFWKDNIVLTADTVDEQYMLRELKLKLLKAGVPFTDPNNFVEEGGEWGPVKKLIFNLK